MVGIYKITNRINNKVYIGQSVNLDARKYDHFERPESKHIYGVIDKEIRNCGKENFNWEILIECSKDELNYYEKYFIELYNSTDPNYGYNVRKGGAPLDNGQARKITDINSLEVFDSTSDCARKINGSQGDIVRVCNHLQGSVSGRELMYLDEYNENGIIKYIPVNNDGLKKLVKCIELDTIYESAHEAGRQLGLNFRSISSVCNGKRQSTGGYTFVHL